MNNGITYYRLKSPYEGDVTKNCGLEGSEIDNNFYVLEGRDVKSVSVIGDDIVLTLYNGDTISAEDALKGYTKDLSFEFDDERGVLIITQNGEVTEIPGFTSGCCPIATDSTLVGDGTPENPLGIASGEQTGHYKPVNGIIDLTIEGTVLPSGDDVHVGDRYVVKDVVDLNGLLYDYKGVKAIACALKQNSSEWRIPTKDDWDNMLNAIEPDKAYANHGVGNGGLWQGQYAGKFLKSTTEEPCGWVDCGEDQDGNCAQNCGDSEDCGNGTNPCVTHDCGHEHVEQTGVSTTSKTGNDCYNFTVEPVGYAIGRGERDKVRFGQTTYFWTGENNGNVAFVKGFDACKTKVHQDIVPLDYFMSLRLVKDYTGSNYYGKENIEGQTFDTVLMPSGTICVTIVQNGTVIDYHIVIKCDDETGECHYELIPVSVGASEEIIEYIQPKLDELEEKINQEIQDRQDADDALSGRIDDVEAKNTEQDGRLDGIDSEIQGLKDKDTDLQNQINELVAGAEGIDIIAKQLINEGNFDTETSEVVLSHSELDEETGEMTSTEIVRVLIPFNFGNI